jgi:outer membrane protein assembly factor BamB
MKGRSLLFVLATFLAAIAAVPAHADAACAGAAPGGDWSSYGATATNSRSQAAETKINATNVGSLQTKFAVATSTIDSTGGVFSNTPVVADGCVFGATANGLVFALNADDGSLAWKNIVTGSSQLLLGGVVVGSPVVGNGLVYVGVSDPGNPYVAAFSEFGDGTHQAGDLVWTTVVEGSKIGFPQGNSLINASPELTPDGLLFMGFSGNEGSSAARGGYTILDAITGERLVHSYTINDAEYAAGYRGASVWCTGAYDAASKYMYACGGNPASKQLEARYSDALLKIDLDRSRATWGQVVDAFKGNQDHYFPSLDQQPACDLQPTLVPASPWSVTCVQLDLDFGASPSLFRDSLGRLMVGDLQKSGVYYGVYADNMEEAWSAVVGGPGPAFNSTSGAVDGSNVYTLGTPGGVLWSLSQNGGRIHWAMPLPDGEHYQSVSQANGVLYVMDTPGNLRTFDASSGAPIAIHNVAQDTKTWSGDTQSNGIAIARNRVYVAQNSYIISYGL